jgi:hypothetical protein
MGNERLLLLIFILVLISLYFNIYLILGSSPAVSLPVAVFSSNITSIDNSTLVSLKDVVIASGSKILPIKPKEFNYTVYKQVIYNNPNLQGDILYNERHKRIESNQKCIPMYYGVVPEIDNDYFNTKSFVCGGKDTTKQFTLDQDFINFKCNGGGKVYLGGTQSEEMIGEHKFKDNWIQYTRPISMGASEYAFGICGQQKFAILRNKFNKAAFDRAKKISEDLHTNSNTSKKPLTFIYLMVDSLSRQNFFRNLKKTASYLKTGLSSSSYSVYDFLLNNIEDTYTTANIAPMLLGNKLKEHNKIVNGSLKIPEDAKKYSAQQNKTAIWKEFENQGFVTMYSVESSKDFISLVTGRKVLVDHTIGGFWRNSAIHMKFVDFTIGPQCIAGKMPHEYSLEYLKNFLENYNGVNKAAFLHINSAHEETCGRIKTLDQPLKELIEFALQFNDDEKVIVIAGDHGRYYNAHTIEAYIEKTMVGHFLIASKSLVDRLGLNESLIFNQDKLNSRLDWYETLKYVSRFPYINQKPKDSAIQASKLNNGSLNLFFEKVNEDRDCENIGIDNSLLCSCHNMIAKVEQSSNLFDEISKRVVDTINKFIKKFELYNECGEIISSRVVNILSFELKKGETKSFKIFTEVLTQTGDAYIEISTFVSKTPVARQSYNRNKDLGTTTNLLRDLNTPGNSGHTIYHLIADKLSKTANSDLKYVCILNNQS